MMTGLILFFLLFIYMVCTFIIVSILISSFYSDYKGAPFVANQKEVIEGSFNLAKLTKTDKLLDIGSGNGLALQIAKDKFGIKKGVGIEVAFWPYLLSNLRLKRYSSITIIRKDIFKHELKSPTVIYAYLFPKLLGKLSKKLFEFLKNNPKARIVTPAFKIKWDEKDAKYINTKVITVS